MAKKSKAKQDDKAIPQKAKREVKVVRCPSAFPISTKTKKRPHPGSDQEDRTRVEKASSNKVIDLHQAARDVREYGAKAFIGKQKRDYEDENYLRLTGRHKKKNSCPLPLLRGLKRAAAKREKKALEQARLIGIVIPKKKEETSRKSMTDADFRKFGPAPNIGFMKSGVYRVSSNNPRGGSNKKHGRRR